jgi:hypothetical protein
MSKSSKVAQNLNQPSLLVNVIVIATLILTLLGSNSVSAIEFTGTVENKNDEKIPHVLVDVIGPTSIATRTDKNGQFKVDLVSGTYTIRLRYNGRRKNFPTDVSNDQNLQTKTFKLNW